ncbi:MAG: hypothetical protein M1546_25810 [Chloroflexi bacterium]|nr:hypothetical protein [Chloroflexota bacterium]
MDRRVEIQLPETVANQIEQVTRTSGKPVNQLIVEAIELWLSERRTWTRLEQQELAIADLTLQGIFRDPTPGEATGAALWNSLSPAEKDAIKQELDHLPAGPSASDVVIAGRR